MSAAPAPSPETFYEDVRLAVVLKGAQLFTDEKEHPFLRLDLMMVLEHEIAKQLPRKLFRWYEQFADGTAKRVDLLMSFLGMQVRLYKTEHRAVEFDSEIVHLYRFRFERPKPNGPLFLTFSFVCDPDHVSNFWATHFNQQIEAVIKHVEPLFDQNAEAKKGQTIQ
jgi:hypothetical protein